MNSCLRNSELLSHWKCQAEVPFILWFLTETWDHFYSIFVIPQSSQKLSSVPPKISSISYFISTPIPMGQATILHPYIMPATLRIFLPLDELTFYDMTRRTEVAWTTLFIHSVRPHSPKLSEFLPISWSSHVPDPLPKKFLVLFYLALGSQLACHIWKDLS